MEEDIVWVMDRTWWASYNPETGEWKEPVCRDVNCVYCKNRPARHPSCQHLAPVNRSAAGDLTL